MSRCIWVIVLFFVADISIGEDFDIAAGEYKTESIEPNPTKFPLEIKCAYSFSELRFNDDWGPSAVLVIRSKDEDAPFFTLGGQVTFKDNRLVLSYTQGFEGNAKPWEIRYLATPFESQEIETTVFVYKQGVVDFTSSLDSKIFSSGRVMIPNIAAELVTFNVSSASGSYKCSTP